MRPDATWLSPGWPGVTAFMTGRGPNFGRKAGDVDEVLVRIDPDVVAELGEHPGQPAEAAPAVEDARRRRDDGGDEAGLTVQIRALGLQSGKTTAVCGRRRRVLAHLGPPRGWG